MQALDIAEGRIEAATTPPPIMTLPDGEDATASGDAPGVDAFLLEAIGHLDQGEGVTFDTLLKNAVARGFVREVAEAKLDDMLDTGVLEEPRFGWFRLAPSE